jgi:hypothetical protein
VARYGGIYTRIARSGGKRVTHVRYAGMPITVDDEKQLPIDIKEDLGIS